MVFGKWRCRACRRRRARAEEAERVFVATVGNWVIGTLCRGRFGDFRGRWEVKSYAAVESKFFDAVPAETKS